MEKKQAVAVSKIVGTYNPSHMNWLQNASHWLAVNWSPLGIGTILGGSIGFAFNVFKWWVPSRADLIRKKEEAKRKKLDGDVLAALADQNLPRSTQGMTGRGMPLTYASEVASYLRIDLDAAEDSLQRLELRGRIRKDEHGWWNIIPH